MKLFSRIIRYIDTGFAAILDPGRDERRRRLTELEVMRQQSDFWHAECRRLYVLMALSGEQEDWVNARLYNEAFKTAQRRYEMEVTQKLDAMK